MGCPHCMQDAKPSGKLMTDETFEQVLAFVREAKPLVVSVTGGEPTEHPYWDWMTRCLLEVKTVALVNILTNGAWIEDNSERLKMAKLIREAKGRVKAQVYSHPKYYQDHEWTVEHVQQFRSIGCIADFESPIFMQDLGRARENCREETEASDHVPSCINSHLVAVQARSLNHFFLMCASAGKFCRPLISPDGGVHMSESRLCPQVAHVSDGAATVFRKMQQSRPCRGCRLYQNFERRFPRELQILDNPITYGK
jgi:organic radical activating enzyme